MLSRITTGWNFQRGLYVAIGAFVVIQSALHKEWLGVVFGSYFAAMGLFAIGCASGACYVKEAPSKNKKEIEVVNFEEVKQK
jgi:uncharacterized membrane protein YedE/YeeE